MKTHRYTKLCQATFKGHRVVKKAVSYFVGPFTRKDNIKSFKSECVLRQTYLL